MIELIIILFFIPRRIKALATVRGESWIKWSLFAVGAWFGAQILIIVSITIALVMYSQATQSEFNENLSFIISYVFGLIGAVMATTVVIRKLTEKNISSDINQNLSE